jgi:hypothetical protein
MMAPMDAPLLLGVVVFLVFGAGILSLTGHRFPKLVQGFIFAAFLLFGVVLALNTVDFVRVDLKPIVWLRGWIGPHDNPGAIGVGLIVDGVSLLASGLAFIMTLTSLLSLGQPQKIKRPERIFGSSAISCAGTVLAWHSATPWFAFVGLAFTLLGGFLALGSHWEKNEDANLASRFGWERFSGLILAIIGTCLLAVGRGSLHWGIMGGATVSAGNPLATSSGVPGQEFLDLFGGFLLALGLFIQFQSFPFLGWLHSRPSGLLLPYTVLAQIAPSAAALAVFFRMEPQLRSLGVFPGWGWFAMSAAVLSALNGMFQKSWREGLSVWITTSTCITLVILVFAGSGAGFAFYVGSQLGGVGLVTLLHGFKTSTEMNEEEGSTSGFLWPKILCFFCIGTASGGLAWVSSVGVLRWISKSFEDPGFAILSFLAYFSYALLGWRLFWLASGQFQKKTPWYFSVPPILYLLLSLGVFWSGTLTGGLVPGETDRLLPSLIGMFFEEVKISEAWVGPTLALAAGTWLLALGVSYWISLPRPGRGRWGHWLQSFPKTAMFIGNGYGIGEIFRIIVLGASRLGRTLNTWVSEKALDEWFPHFVGVSLRKGSGWLDRLEPKISKRLNSGIHASVEVPAKLLQLIQSGNMQWYLFFGIGVAFAMLLHFLRV